jgi:hypothetical protein
MSLSARVLRQRIVVVSAFQTNKALGIGLGRRVWVQIHTPTEDLLLIEMVVKLGTDVCVRINVIPKRLVPKVGPDLLVRVSEPDGGIELTVAANAVENKGCPKVPFRVVRSKEQTSLRRRTPFLV